MRIDENVSFGTALNALKQGLGIRLPFWSEEVIVRAQFTDENSKMSHPYFYVESRLGLVPWIPTYPELFAEDWEIYNSDSCCGDCNREVENDEQLDIIREDEDRKAKAKAETKNEVEQDKMFAVEVYFKEKDIPESNRHMFIANLGKTIQKEVQKAADNASAGK